MNIGNWIRRKGQKWHLVESVVAEDAITRCGRRMDRVTRSGGELQVSAVMPLTRMIGQPQLCKAGCDDQTGDGRVNVTVHVSASSVGPEDDGSTAPVEDGA